MKKVLAHTSPHPINLPIKKANGSIVTDIDNNEYIDLIAGVGVNNLGHNIEEIKDAVVRQMDLHSHVMVYGEYDQTVVSEFSFKLTSFLPNTLNTVYPVNSGTEAIEAAIKLCRKVTNRIEIISFKGAYHGNTMGAMSISWNEYKKAPFRPLLPSVKFIELNNHEDLQLITTKTAGVFLETIQGDAGVRIPNNEYIKALRDRCTEVDALLVLDEIQCGYGRTGSFFAFEKYDLIPDLLTLGKALGAGLPIGALVGHKDLLKSFESEPALGHITTFGGNPVICAAALAGLEYLGKHDILNQVETKGELIENLIRNHPKIKAFRRVGLMIGIELENADQVNQFISKCRDSGVLLFWFLSLPNGFRISPPLTIENHLIRESCQIIRQVLDEL